MNKEKSKKVGLLSKMCKYIKCQKAGQGEKRQRKLAISGLRGNDLPTCQHADMSVYRGVNFGDFETDREIFRKANMRALTA